MENKVNGILLLDKPQGITSNQALQRVKRLFGANNKVGHTGSLDPLATGMLPICFGEATKFSAFLLNSDKKYLVTAQLGIKTDTGDLDGNIIATESNKIYSFTESQLEAIFKNFIGDVVQVPPMYSAIKQDGVRLYKLARKNIEVVVKPRIIKINSIKLINLCNDKGQITLEVDCGKGTYIRTLMEDLGVALNCLATVKSLRRITVGNFAVSKMVNILELEKLLSVDFQTAVEQILLPVTDCLTSLPVLEISNANAQLLHNGQIVYIDHVYAKYGTNTLICLITEEKYLVGVGEVLDGNKIVAKRLVKSL